MRASESGRKVVRIGTRTQSVMRWSVQQLSREMASFAISYVNAPRRSGSKFVYIDAFPALAKSDGVRGECESNGWRWKHYDSLNCAMHIEERTYRASSESESACLKKWRLQCDGNFAKYSLPITSRPHFVSILRFWIVSRFWIFPLTIHVTLRLIKFAHSKNQEQLRAIASRSLLSVR